MSLSKIDNIIVVMMENRSFDHMLGSLNLRGHACDGLAAGMSNVDAQGQPHPIRRLDDTFFPCDPDHSSGGVARQLANGNGGFVLSFTTSATPIAPALQDPGLVMGYYDDTQLATFEYLARNFAICDRYFSPLPGPTWPNRLYSVAGTSAGEKDNPGSTALHRYSMPTIFDYLDTALAATKKTDRWGYFHAGPFGFPLVFNQHLDDILPGRKRVRPMKDFFKLAAAGTLPHLSWIEPDYRSSTRNNDHPEGDVLFGQEFVARVYNAVRFGGANLWERSLLVVTYDEHGGFYDHVAPSSAPAPADEYFRVYGVRVPTLVVSPWVGKGVVHSAVLDHTSILKTILNRFFAPGQVPAMTARVSAATDLGPLLTQTAPRTDTTSIPVTPVPSAAVAGAMLGHDLAEGHDAATAGVIAKTRPKDIDLARRDHVRVAKSDYQVLAEAYAADLRARKVPVPKDDSPEMGEASEAVRRRFGVVEARTPSPTAARGAVGRSRKKGKARPASAMRETTAPLPAKEAERIVQAASDGPHPMARTLAEAGLLTPNERARFAQRVRNGVLAGGRAIRLDEIPADGDSTLTDVRDAIQAAASA
jgi:phospholipase C